MESANRKLHVKDAGITHMQREIKITEIPVIMEPLSEISNITPLSVPGCQSSTAGSEDLAIPFIRRMESTNGKLHIEDTGITHMQREIKIMEIPVIMEPSSESPNITPLLVPGCQSTTDGHQEVCNRNLLNLQLDPNIPDRSDPIIQSPNCPYWVEFPQTEMDFQTTRDPLMGLSPISAVTSGLNRIHLKRTLELLDVDQPLNPTKKRLVFVEPLEENIALNHPTQPTTIAAQSLNIRNLKKAIRGNRKKNSSKHLKTIPPALYLPPEPHPPITPTESSHLPITSDTILNADGCHQAAIGPRDLQEALNSVTAKIDDASNDLLLRPITREEVRLAAFELGGSKAPSPDGFSVQIWKDKWIPTIPTYRLNTTDEELKNSNQRLSSIIAQDGGGWNLNLIRPYINDEICDSIRAIPVPRAPYSDRLRWTQSQSGCYSVKKGYYLTSSAVHAQPAGSPILIPSDIWMTIKFDQVGTQSFKQWWLDIMHPQSCYTDYDKAHISWLLWYIWKSRNEKVFSGVTSDPSSLIEQVNRSLMAFWKACYPEDNLSKADDRIKSPIAWEPPPGNNPVPTKFSYVVLFSEIKFDNEEVLAWGTDAPESEMPYGKEATEEFIRLLKENT
ncbi:hypothetical protein K1719_023225 [Acacia pycnantha]|nr:hypothetical protein K1719_023225 [Acacia pycnantha]